jgi:tripartite-type tricarboxylate transporter receptor subunit TctC
MSQTTSSPLDFMTLPARRFIPALRAARLLPLAAALFLAGGAGAQPYPSKPIRVIVPFPPGAGVDLVTRLITPRVGEALGQQLIVDNRAGAAGHIGAELAAKAPADGYTLLLAPASIVISQSLYTKLTYNLERDFEPVAPTAAAPFVLVVHPSLPIRSVREFVAFAKARPGQVNYASTGNGGTPHLAMEVFRRQVGIDIVHIPYKGTPPAVTDIIAGQVSAMFGNTLSVLPHIQSGRLRALAVSSLKRTAAAPQLPTIAESGAPGFDATTWFGLYAPAGIPRDIVVRLNTEVRRSVQLPEIRDKLVAQGADPMTATPEEFKKFVHDELIKWGKAVKASGVRIE